MINHGDLRKIIELAIYAPSGENCQPWRFEVRGDEIDIFNIPERDQSPYNFDQRGSLVAHGTLIENVLIASSTSGYKTKLDIFPEAHDRNLVARIVFEKSSTKEEPLYPYIKIRCTNRKPYKKDIKLTPEQKSEILASANEVGEGAVKLTEDPHEIGALAKVGSMNERLVFENPHLHNFLFTHINWTKHEEMKKRLGFYIKTLEIPEKA
ncbi:MAG: nitroreductase, partial [Candidatus Nealsonbacteria bacterium]|nr:nitroreductase [Candidatus Nealsonbacteria bacterium]